MALKPKRIFFWLHLITGIVCGLVIAVLATTGAIYAFQGEIQAVARRDVARVTPGETRVPLDDLMKSVRKGNPDAQPSGIVVYKDPAAATQVMMGREKPSLYANPYTGEVKPDSAVKLSGFFAFVLQIHRWLALGGENRKIGGAITGACATAFLFLSLSGLYLWWPRSWKWRTLKPSTWFIKGAKGKVRDWNWHNVFGFWSLPLLIVLSATGMMMSYRWASNLLYIVAGETPPVARAEGRPGESRDGENSGAKPAGEPVKTTERAPGASPETARGEGAPEGGASPGGMGREGPAAPAIQPPEPGARPLGYDVLFAIAQKESPDWASISFRMQAARGAGAPGARSSRPQQGGEPVASSVTPRDPAAGVSEEQPRRRRRNRDAEGEAVATTASGAGEAARAPGENASGEGRSEPRGEGRRSRGTAPVSVIVRREGLPLTANLTLTLNPYTGEVIKREGFADKSLGNKLRGSVRSVHTGEAFSIPGQLLMFLACIAALILVYTGFALSWRRFFPGKKNRHHQHRDDGKEPAVFNTAHEPPAK